MAGRAQCANIFRVPVLPCCLYRHQLKVKIKLKAVRAQRANKLLGTCAAKMTLSAPALSLRQSSKLRDKFFGYLRWHAEVEHTSFECQTKLKAGCAQRAKKFRVPVLSRCC